MIDADMETESIVDSVVTYQRSDTGMETEGMSLVTTIKNQDSSAVSNKDSVIDQKVTNLSKEGDYKRSDSPKPVDKELNISARQEVIEATPGPANHPEVDYELDSSCMYLNERIRPSVPEPNNSDEMSEGWMAINRIGGWKSFLVSFQLLEEVPNQHKGAWCTAWKESLLRFKNAKTTLEANTALM